MTVVHELEPVLLWPGDPPGPSIAGDGQVPRLVPVLPECGGSSRPACIVCPGGGYTHLAEHEGLPVARRLAEAGFAAFVLHYRVRPYFLPAALDDACRAVRLVRHRAQAWGVDDRHVAMLGFSAGGHLAACVATLPQRCPLADEVSACSPRPDALVCGYSPVSLPAMGRGDRHGWLLGEDASPEMLKRIELDRHVTNANPPTFLWHTDDDSLVPCNQSILLARALAAAAVPVALHVFAGGRHGLGLADGEPEASQWPRLLIRWFSEMNWPVAGNRACAAQQ